MACFFFDIMYFLYRSFIIYILFFPFFFGFLVFYMKKCFVQFLCVCVLCMCLATYPTVSCCCRQFKKKNKTKRRKLTTPESTTQPYTTQIRANKIKCALNVEMIQWLFLTFTSYGDANFFLYYSSLDRDTSSIGTFYSISVIYTSL